MNPDQAKAAVVVEPTPEQKAFFAALDANTEAHNARIRQAEANLEAVRKESVRHHDRMRRALGALNKAAAPSSPDSSRLGEGLTVDADDLRDLQLLSSRISLDAHPAQGDLDAQCCASQPALERAMAALRRLSASPGVAGDGDCHGLDTPERVRFYEHDFYPLSNFSAFRVNLDGQTFDTSEAAYHWAKFPNQPEIRQQIKDAPSAHEAFKIAERNAKLRRMDWTKVRLDIMRRIVRAKREQHEYVHRKLLATGDRLLVEDSWRDNFWGWGPDGDGENWLGKIWMEERAYAAALGTVQRGLSNTEK